MKKLLITLVVIAFSCMALFASGKSCWTAGLFQSTASTSVTGSFVFDGFEIEGGLGLPILTALGFGNGNVYTDETPEKVDAVIRHPVISLSATYAVITMDFDSFDAFLRLGLMTDMTLSCTKDFRLVGSYGIATVMDIKLQSFRFGIQASIPAANLLSLAGASSRKGYYVIGGWDALADSLSGISFDTATVRLFGKYLFH